MLSGFKDLFSFSSTERSGIIVLLTLIVLVAAIPWIYRLFWSPKEFDCSEFENEIKEFEKRLILGSNTGYSSEYHDSNNPAGKGSSTDISFFPFNPNGLEDEKWRELGLKDWQIRIIRNYEAKGGRFKKKEDLKKIYGISEEQYREMEPYVMLPPENRTVDNKDTTKKWTQRNTIMVDLNSADTNELMKLRGIGTSFARRIVKYRELLGGFCQKHQLLEVYGFDEKRLELITNDCTVDSGPFRKIPVNTISVAELMKHPYFSYNLARIIIDHRIQKGNYSDIGQVKGLPGMDEETFRKIAPYLKLE